MSHRQLTFFCELPDDELTKLFDGRFVIDDLNDLHANLSLGILSLSETRANVVKRLNKAGVPVIAWLLLPEEQGYWFNIDNFKEAAARYIAFKGWTAEYNLTWTGIGLDIEPNIDDIRNITKNQKIIPRVGHFIQKHRNKKQIRDAQRSYQALIDVIHADGYDIESYLLPLIIEERKAKATILQRTLGLVDLKVDREVLMLYSSFLRPDGAAAIWCYASQADSVGVGSTGGGVNIDDVIDVTPLSWEEFSRDLRLGVKQDKAIHIFSLEGCVNQGFLSKLNTFDWKKPVDIPDNITKVRCLRIGLASLLWVLERPLMILMGLATLIGLGFLFTHRRTIE